MVTSKRWYIPRRYILVILTHIGYLLLYATRVNLSVALVAMIGEPGTTSSLLGNSTSKIKHSSKRQFDWNQKEQGLILSAFFNGYVFLQIPGGILAKRYGGKFVCSVGMLVSFILTMLTPIAAYTNYYLLYAVRFLLGLVQGVASPAFIVVLGKWTPKDEKARMVAIATTGMDSGAVIALLFGGILCSTSFLGGWPSVFYVFGLLGLIWFFLWVILIAESPEKHTSICEYEANYIIESQNGSTNSTGNSKIPWLEIFTSLPVWSILVADFAQTWVFYFILTDLPIYFQDVLHFHIKENGIYSSLPLMSGFISQLASGFLADYLSENCFSVVNVRKLLVVLGLFPAAIFLVLVSYTGYDQRSLCVAFIVILCGILLLPRAIFFANILDLSPRFSGILTAILGTFLTFTGVASPLVTGSLTNNAPTMLNYRKVFYINAALCVVGGTFFCIFAKGKEQSWNHVDIPSGERAPFLDREKATNKYKTFKDEKE